MTKPTESFWFTSRGLMAFCAIVFISYFLLIEHREHLVEWLPYLILLLCPLMHLFMHRGHGHHHSGHSEENSDDHYKSGYKAGLRDQQLKNREQERDHE